MKMENPIVHLLFHDEKWHEVLPHGDDDLVPVFQAIRQILGQDFEGQSVTIVLSEDGEVQDLNKTFRSYDKPTNVLSFPSDEEESLGDIILAYETVEKEAIDAGISVLHHTFHLIIHGFLHLLGYDHEKDEDADQMESLEVHILNVLHIPNPYEAQ